MLKKLFTPALLFAGLALGNVVNAQTAVKDSPVAAKDTPVATTVTTTKGANVTGLVDNTPKNDTPLEKVIRSATPIVETADKGTVNWTEQYVEAVGTSVIDNERFTNKAQARAMATRGAVVDAQRNLLETIKGVEVTGTTTVENFMTVNDAVTTKISGVIKGAYMVGKARTTEDGAIEVTMRVPLYAKNGVAGAVYSEVDAAIAKNSAIMAGDSAAKPSTAVAADGTTIIVNNDTKPSGARTAGSASTTSTAASTLTTEDGKPIVFKLAGQEVNPSMFPVIYDKDGKVALDMSKLYDTKNGTFPKILQTGKNLLQSLGLSKQAEVVNLIQDKATGQLRLDDVSKKINWQKIGNTVGKIAKFLLMVI